MIKRLFFRVTVACAILFFLGIGSANALDDGFGRAKRVEGAHFIIYYVPELELSSLIQQLNVSPSDKLLVGKSTERRPSQEYELADMLDTLFMQVCNILDMQLYSFKSNIKICSDSTQLKRTYRELFDKDPKKSTVSFYAYSINTIYASADNFKLGIIGHEIAHAIISHYFVVLPSEKIQELLATYVEYQLRTPAQ